MIRMMGLVTLQPVGSLRNEETLTDKQKQLDVDKDGKIEGEDLAKLRSKKNEELKFKIKKDAIDRPVLDIKEKNINEEDNPQPSNDHEVSMANNSLDAIIQHANDLKTKLGQEEKDIPAWIQDHITNAANFISQAANNYHEYNTPDQPEQEPINEKAPEGWEGTVKAMKKHKEIDNPWALAYYMKSKGYKSYKGK